MATNTSDNKSPVLRMGQLWHTIDDNVTADGEDTEDEEDIHRGNTETMKLRREDMSLFGICPAWDQFYLVVCEFCKQVIKPQALQRHIELRHSFCKQTSNQLNNNSLKIQTNSTKNSTTTTLSSISSSLERTAIADIKTQALVNGNTDNNDTKNSIDMINNNINNVINKSKNSDKIYNKDLVRSVCKSDVKVLLDSNDIKRFLLDNSVVDKNCVNSNEVMNKSVNIDLKNNSKLINLLSPNMSTTLDTLLPEPTGPGPGYSLGFVSADKNSVTISLPEININNKYESMPDLETAAPVVTVAPKKKSYKKNTSQRKLLPCKDREYDPNKHCGVCPPEAEKPCTRSLTCKTHSLTLRRAVTGRSKSFDMLLTEHREAKEAALRAQGIDVKPTKKSVQRQQQLLKVSNQLKDDQNQYISDKNNYQSTGRTFLSDSQLIDTNISSNKNSLLSHPTTTLVSSNINYLSRKSQHPKPSKCHLRLDQIEMNGLDGIPKMPIHPKPAAVCNYNIRKSDGIRLISRNCDLTLANLRATFNTPLIVSKLVNRQQKCTSNVSQTPTTQISVKSPVRTNNQSFSANKKLRTSIDCEPIPVIKAESPSVATMATETVTGDPYSFTDAFIVNNSNGNSNSANSYTYVKPKTTITKNSNNTSKKSKKSKTEVNCFTQNSSLLSNGHHIVINN
ncbi:ataxin-7-like protein 1 [Oppia nitens]|uniref:ataxin-7-like protein 1 n=1 Tax=Oppia nitens TaxID=1686743 RepID=UPI0023D9DD66|nr:ataxin-7-like protein 1 [Oppia nitens]